MNKYSALEMAAIAANPNNYIPVEDVDLFEDANPEDICLKNEQEDIWKAAFSLLSEEAKQVIEIMLDCPEELVGIITSCKKSKKVCYKKVLSYLRRLWGERAIVRQVDREIKTFATTCRITNFSKERHGQSKSGQ